MPVLLWAQEDQEPPVEVEAGRPQTADARIYGKVTDARTGKGAEAVSVQLFAFQKDSSGAITEVPAGGMLTRSNGDFSISGFPQADSFRLVLTAVGFQRKTQIIKNTKGPLDLGNLTVEQDVQTLQSVTVTASRPALQMDVDKRVFSAERNLTATGGTAIDVMKNIPSVTVDVDGNVQLRNASPQLFVDGRPTILTLDQIPADNIDRVELITNPSAKFDASSSGGIINIILKKNKRAGINGIVSAGVGHPDIASGNLNLNLRQGKFNTFLIGSYFQGGGRARSEALRQNKSDGLVESYFNQYSYTERLRRFGSLRFGADYFLDNRNTISLTQNIVNGRFNNDGEQQQEYLNAAAVLDHTGERFSIGRSRFQRYNTQLNYTHKFPQAGREFSANINYNQGKGSGNTVIENNFYYPDGSLYAGASRLRNADNTSSNQWTFQADYVSPKGESEKLEAGVRSFINEQHSIFNSYSVANGLETKLSLSNNYRYREQVNAAYFTYTSKWKGIGYQAGLRAEHSQFDGELVDSAQKFGYTYPSKASRLFDALFPSLYLSRPLSENTELQLNYSRRIRRPDFWNLNPFADISDPQNISQGNPYLRPEYTNSIEFNLSQNYKSGNFLGSVYFRNNQGDITRYSDTISAAQYAQLNNSVIDSNAILSTFINAQYTNRIGAEFTLQQKFGTAFDLTPTLNLQYRKVKGQAGGQSLDNEGFNWEAKLIANYRFEPESETSLWRNFSVQAIGEYESKEVVPQGYRIPNYSLDMALRKDFLKGKKATLTFSVQDVFNSLRFGSVVDTDAFYQDSWNRRNVRSFRLVFSYKFGNADFTLGGRRNGDRNSDDD